MRALLAGARLLRVLAHVVAGLYIYHAVFPRLDAAARRLRVRRWQRGLLVCFGLRAVLRGTPPASGPLLLVANHVSWLDIAALQSACDCRFVSKADVRRWPLIGALANAADTLYIERESRRDAMRVVHRMADALRAGDLLAVFPEGTTSDGLGELLPFHANLLQAAISAAAPAAPVAIDYRDAASGRPTSATAYVGDDSLLASIWRAACAPPLEVVVSFGAPQQAAGRERRGWAEALRAEVQALRAKVTT